MSLELRILQLTQISSSKQSSKILTSKQQSFQHSTKSAEKIRFLHPIPHPCQLMLLLKRLDALIVLLVYISFIIQLRIDLSKSFLLKQLRKKLLLEPFNIVEHSEKWSSFVRTNQVSSSIVSSFLGSMKLVFFLKKELQTQLKSMLFLVRHSE